jgi:hypothetical protein
LRQEQTKLDLDKKNRRGYHPLESLGEPWLAFVEKGIDIWQNEGRRNALDVPEHLASLVGIISGG